MVLALALALVLVLVLVLLQWCATVDQGDEMFSAIRSFVQIVALLFAMKCTLMLLAVDVS
jgi:hypothetical protein